MVMERIDSTKKRSEPALVPEWLKGTQNGGSSLHHLTSSHSDDQPGALLTRNRSSVSSCDHDSPRSSAFTDRTSFRRSLSTNGSLIHDKEPSSCSRNYTTSSRSHRDRDHENGFDFRSLDRRGRDYSDSLSSTNNFTSRIEKETSRRSQPAIQTKRDETWLKTKRSGSDVNNGLNTGKDVVSNIHKASFDRDFPTLGGEEKQGFPGISRVSSPGLSTASQSLPMGTLPVIGGDGWTSALVELPATVGTNSTVLSPSQQTTAVSSVAVLPSNSCGLNMAEALVQPPIRTRAVTPISVETQKLEELTIKQFKQLIPVTPSMTKSLGLNSSDKAKTKGARTGESNIVKGGQQHLTSQSSLNMRGSTRVDASKTSQIGKLHPLKGSRESNGVVSAAKDISSLTNVSKPSQAALKSPSNPKVAPDTKVASLLLTQGSSFDRKPLPQVQNRIDFFNSLRKKTSVNQSTATSGLGPALSPIPVKSDGESVAVADSVSEVNDTLCTVPGIESLDWSAESGTDVTCNGDICQESEIYSDGEQKSGSYVVIIPDEEEAAFLRRLGWEENAKYEALTEEEISAFYNEHKEKRLASKLFQKMQSKIVPLESHVSGMGAVSSGLISSDGSE